MLELELPQYWLNPVHSVHRPPVLKYIHCRLSPYKVKLQVTSVNCHSSEVDVEMVDQEANAQPASKVAKMKRRGKRGSSSRNSGSRKNSTKASLESVAPSSVLITGSDVGSEGAVSAASEASVSVCSKSGITIDSEGAEHVALTLPSFDSPLATCNESEIETQTEVAVALARNVRSESLTPFILKQCNWDRLGRSSSNGYNCAFSLCMLQQWNQDRSGGC